MSETPRADKMADALSGAVSRLYLDTFGKGPVDVRTSVHGDTALTVMRDVLTPAEHTMIAEGRQDSVLTTRMMWQHATDEMFRTAAREATGREVLTVISGFQLDAAMATEVFIFAPA